MFTVYNVGMIYFDGCRVNEKRALVPDGTKGDKDTNTPRHYCSLFVGADKVDMDRTNWWWGYKFEREVTFVDDAHKSNTMRVYEFRIKEPSEVTFPDKRNGQPARFEELEYLPRLQSDTHFQLADDPRTIARVPLRGGVLEACALMGVPVVVWKVEHHADPLTITARTDEGGLYTIVLKDAKTLKKEEVPFSDDITMVFSNTPDFIALMENSVGHDHGDEHPNGGNGHAPGRGADGDEKHFEHGVIYGKLNKAERKVTLSDDLRPELKPVRLKQGYIKDYLEFLAASRRYRQSDCTPTCCTPTPPPEENPGSGGGGGS